MSDFPLYSSIKTNLPNRDLTVTEKLDFINRIKEYDVETHELVCALIKCYYTDNGGSPMTIPYDGKLVKDRIDFNLLDFPIKLRQLLYKFIKLHKRKIKEDEEIKIIQDTSSLREE
jgi:hypothetical protein